VVHALRMPALVARRRSLGVVEPVMGAWQGEVVALMVTHVYKKYNRVKKSCPFCRSTKTSLSLL
jgi:hypothetical protein